MSGSETYEIKEDGSTQVMAGEPSFPPVVAIPIFGREFPLMHGESIVVQGVSEEGGVIVAITHSEMESGLFLGVSPALARSIATWLLSAADDIDGGATKQ